MVVEGLFEVCDLGRLSSLEVLDLKGVEFTCIMWPTRLQEGAKIARLIIFLLTYFSLELLVPVGIMSSFSGILGASNQYGRWVPEQEWWPLRFLRGRGFRV